MYEDLVKRLRADADYMDNNGIMLYAAAPFYRECADAIEELSLVAESNERSAARWAETAGMAVEQIPRWIPVTARPMDEEERKEWSEKLGYDIEYNEALIYTSQLPDDGQEVLTFSKYGGIRIDKFEDDPDYGCFFEENGDMDGIVAWMPLPPLPEPPKGET